MLIFLHYFYKLWMTGSPQRNFVGGKGFESFLAVQCLISTILPPFAGDKRVILLYVITTRAGSQCWIITGKVVLLMNGCRQQLVCCLWKNPSHSLLAFSSLILFVPLKVDTKEKENNKRNRKIKGKTETRGQHCPTSSQCPCCDSWRPCPKLIATWQHP